MIAQHVQAEEELSEFVINDEEYIANIYCNGIYNNKIITSSKNINGLININDESKLILDNKNDTEFIIEETPYHNRYKRRYVKVIYIIDDYSFEIDNEIKVNSDNIVFIYGKKVDDFKKSDYSSMYSLNIAATQELYIIIQDLQVTLCCLQNRI